MIQKKAQVIAFMNNKGGVLKTTIATNLASLLAKKNKKVLIIDLDSQGNVALSFGINPDQFEWTITDVLLNFIRLETAIQSNIIKNLDLCPSNLKLNDFIDKYSESSENETILQNVLQEVLHKYDYIIIDSSPHLDLLTKNIIKASDQILIPVQMELLAARGLVNLTNVFNDLGGKIKAIIPTLFDTRTIIHSDILNQITQMTQNKRLNITKTVITKSIKAANANAYHQVPLVLTTAKGKWVEQYFNLAEELGYISQEISNDEKSA